MTVLQELDCVLSMPCNVNSVSDVTLTTRFRVCRRGNRHAMFVYWVQLEGLLVRAGKAKVVLHAMAGRSQLMRYRRTQAGR